MVDSAAMIDVCRRFTEKAPADVVIREPYIPLIPKNWNGLLVLAEAQNLSDPNGVYEQELEQMTPEQRWERLKKPSGLIGVGPWDDGSMKLMLKSMIPEIDLNRVAVSNAVPWSYQKGLRTNINPKEDSEGIASKFWGEIIDIISPQLHYIITFGNVAERVLHNSGVERSRIFKLRLPSPLPRNLLCNMFNENDLLKRYPEVQKAAESLGMQASRENAMVLFACHAVSVGKKHFEGLF